MEYFYTIIAGVLAGFSSGMFGIGGSVVSTPILSLALGMAPLLAIATPLPAALPSAISGSITYYRNSLINFRIAFTALASAIPFALVGTFSTEYINADFLLICKALLLVVLGMRFLMTGKSNQKNNNQNDNIILSSLVSGAIAGFVSGILAVGGGIVLVSAFHRINLLPIKSSIATSLLCVGVLALFNSIGHYNLGNIDIEVAIILIVCVIPFSYLGSRLAVSLKNSTLEKAFGIILIIFALYFIVFRLITIL